MTPNTEQFVNQRRVARFREYKPYARGNATRITDEQWKPHFTLIRGLHNARRTRTQILEVLREHGFEPSVTQLYAKMAKWGLKGYGSGNTCDQEGATLSADSDVPEASLSPPVRYGHDTQMHTSDSAEDSSENSEVSRTSSNCFSVHEADSSDTVYDTEGPPAAYDCEEAVLEYPTNGPIPTSPVLPEPCSLDDVVRANRMSVASESSDGSSLKEETTQKLPSDLMAFVHSTVDLGDFDKHDILNEVASFLCATSSFSDAFALFDASYGFLKDNHAPPMALVFATINCLRSATFKEQCQYVGSLMGEALGSFRLISYTNPYAATAFMSLEEIGRELCVNSELEHLNILYTQMQITGMCFSANDSSECNTNEVLLHCSDPFQLARANDRPELMIQSLDVSSIALGRIIGKLSRWCCSAIDDFNPVSMLPSAGFNPSDPVSVARFATALSCHFVRKWSFLSLAEVLAYCNELLPPNRKDAAARLGKLAVRVLSTLAVYTINQATGVTLRCVSNDDFCLPEIQAQYVSPLASHLDVLSRMGSKERLLVFAETHKTLYNRTLVYRRQIDDHCLIAHVRETGFLLAASLIRLKRELSTEVPQPAAEISRAMTPIRDSHSPSRRSSDSSSSMRNLARRNLLLPGIMSKNGTHMRTSWTRRLSNDSNESWNFAKVTGFPTGSTPPESLFEMMHCDNNYTDNNDANDEFENDDDDDNNNNNNDEDIDMDMMDMNMF